MHHSKKENYLIIGGDGFLGRALSQHLRAKGNRVIASSRRVAKTNPRYFDLRENNYKILNLELFDAVFICAGVTSILSCEANLNYSDDVNIRGTKKLIQKIRKKSIFVVYISSSCVFDGTKKLANENDIPRPTSRYGYQKAQIEKYLKKHQAFFCAIRFGKISNGKFPIFQKWENEIKEKTPATAFSDFRLSPVHLQQAVEILAKAAKVRLRGIINCTSTTQLSYRQALKIFAKENNLNLIKRPNLYAKNHPELTKVWRKNSLLNNSKIQKELEIKLPSAYQVIKKCSLEFKHEKNNL